MPGQCHQNVTCGPGRFSPKMSPVYLVTVTKNVTCVPGECLQKCHLCTWSLSPKMSPVCLVTVTKNVTCVPGHCHPKQSSLSWQAPLVQSLLRCAVLWAQDAGIRNPWPAGNLQLAILFHAAVVPNSIYSNSLPNDLLIQSDFFTSLNL